MIGALILIAIVLVLVGVACWSGREPNKPGHQAGDSTGASRSAWWVG